LGSEERSIALDLLGRRIPVPNAKNRAVERGVIQLIIAHLKLILTITNMIAYGIQLMQNARKSMNAVLHNCQANNLLIGLSMETRSCKAIAVYAETPFLNAREEK
jgi:hypothetical protein